MWSAISKRSDCADIFQNIFINHIPRALPDVLWRSKNSAAAKVIFGSYDLRGFFSSSIDPAQQAGSILLKAAT